LSFLVDTKVISELRKREKADPAVQAWFASVADEEIFLSVPGPLPVIDGVLAATAKVTGLTLATGNAGDVERTGVDLVNPFAG
jgi:predicted nucleic acid-binding protein